MRFIVEGPPVGQERARQGINRATGRPIWYTPAKTSKYKLTVAMAFLRANGHQRMRPEAVSVTVHCFFKNGVHPDADNVQKLVVDALQELAYKNDRTVASENTLQMDPKRPRIEVEVT